MVIQRISIRAPAGRLRVISVWRSLALAGARVYGWGVKVDAATGNECMTIDLAGCSEEKLANLAAVLSSEPLGATVTACSLLTLDGGADEEEAVGERGRR
jgi:hypothetical protein